MTKRQNGFASYEHVDSKYLDKRQLKPSANWVLLWAMGVGAVISGDYFGWNFGLVAGGFWGLAIATVAMAVMYVCMVFSIAELSAALPHAGGFYSFVRNALGPTGGFICGVTDTIEYIITPAVIVAAISGYMNELVFDGSEQAPAWATYAWWISAYAIFVTINILGVELSLKVGLVVTGLAAAVLCVFYASVIGLGKFDSDLLFNIPPTPGNRADWLPFGIGGIFIALPNAIWFYLAIEQLPLAAEETHDVVRDMPRALLLAIGTLVLLSLFTLVLNTGVGGGAAAIGVSEAPLADGFKAVLDDRATNKALSLVALTGLVASFHAVIYAYGRVLFSLSRAGYFPRWISIVNARSTPQIALVLGGVIGLAWALLIERTTSSDEGASEASVGNALIYMAVLGAVVSYALVMISYIKLKISRPDLHRPYVSPLGIPGAAVGAVLALVALGSCFAIDKYRVGVYGMLIVIAICMVYYIFYSRRRLVAQAPEERIALSRGIPMRAADDSSKPHRNG